LAEGALVAAWMDGYRRDVFAALYEVRRGEAFHDDRLELVDAPSVDAPAQILQRWESRIGERPVTFVGDGARLYAAVIDASPLEASIVSETPLLAGPIALVAAARHDRGLAPSAAAVQPLYVRRPDA
jgi:tRNA A37 threonylcarbamoyladenosine modification protein TsaB